MTHWQCKPNSNGWMIEVERGQCRLGYQIKADEWRDAQDRAWLFWNRVEVLARNMDRVEAGR